MAGQPPLYSEILKYLRNFASKRRLDSGRRGGREAGKFGLIFNLASKTEYWVSNARKYCDFCKCSIADNKPSVQAHENGKKHKENVRKRLSEMSKKATKDANAEATVEKQMKSMEKAAMKAYMKDMEANPDYTSQLIKEKMNSLSSPADPVPPDKPTTKKKTVKWLEAKSDEGHTYYWHSETGESKWESPEEGFLSIEEQETSHSETSKPQMKKPRDLSVSEINQKIYSKGATSTVKIEKDAPDTVSDVIVGPSPRANPYGTWTAVVKEEQSVTDLQLPEVKIETFQIPLPPLEERQRSFKERKAPTSNVVGEVSFKKRKFNSARSTRERRTDD